MHITYIHESVLKKCIIMIRNVIYSMVIQRLARSHVKTVESVHLQGLARALRDSLVTNARQVIINSVQLIV